MIPFVSSTYNVLILFKYQERELLALNVSRYKCTCKGNCWAALVTGGTFAAYEGVEKISKYKEVIEAWEQVVGDDLGIDWGEVAKKLIGDLKKKAKFE